MKMIFIVVGISVMLMSCSLQEDEALKDYSVRMIQLKNDLGTVKIKLPKQMDTTYQWMDISDCGPCCDHYKYRFVKRGYSALAETGDLYAIWPDSVWQLTIQHLAGQGCGVHYPINQATLDMWIKKFVDKESENSSKKWTLQWHMREVKRIRGRLFAVYAYSDTANVGQFKNVSVISAITEINKQYVEFNFNCGSSECADFYETMRPALESIEIDTVSKSK